MFDHSKNVVVSGGSLTVVHGNSVTQHAGYPTNNRAGIQALKTLHKEIAAGAMHNSKERYDDPKCHPDTRKAVLSDITSWVSDYSKKTSILWLTAPAGSGKSAILQQIAENFHRSGGLSASFFFSRSVAKRKTDAYLIATLASQLATSIPATRPFIEGAIERDPSIFQRVLSEQMDHLVVFPLVYASLHPENGSSWPTLLVIDGLDECNGGKRQAGILRVFRTALLQLKFSLPTLYLLIASRPEPAITAVFDHELLDITHRIVLDDAYDPDQDIAAFLQSSFSDIYRRRHARFPSMASLPQPWPPEDVISFLVGKSSGQFIFAATVIRFIDVDRKIPIAQLQLILDICGSMDSSRFAANPFALLDELYSHILNSSEETERVITILGAIFYLNDKQSLTVEFLRALLRLEPEDLTMIFWDLHSIVHIPVSDKDPIHFYHASLRDFLLDRYRSGNLYIDGSKAHSFLLKSCIQTLSDFHSGSTQGRTALAQRYSRKYWMTHYVDGDDLNPGFLDKVLKKFNLETWLPLHHLADATAFISWWKDSTPLRDRFHGRCDSEKRSTLCSQYTSILDQYLVHRYHRHKSPAVAAALMWLTLLSPAERALIYMGHEFAMQDSGWLWVTREDPGRSHNLFVGSAISSTHFAHVCAERAWRGILALDHPLDAENWRMVIYLSDILNVLLPREIPHERSSKLRFTNETITQHIQMRISDLADLVKFVEATGWEGTFVNQVLRWRNHTRTWGTSLIKFTAALSREQAVHDEVRTPRNRVKREAQPAPLSNKGKKRRKIIAIDHMDPGRKTVNDSHVPAHHEGKASINDGRDIEHAIVIDSD